MEHIFICYSRPDQNFALELKKVLEKTGKETWIDLKHLPASSIWRKEIEEAITESIAFIYLVSENSLRSDYCQNEFEYAQKLNKRIFPILLPGITDKDVPESISSRQWLLWSSFGETLSNVDKLITDIETNHKWVKFITDLGVEEFRWRKDKDNSRLLHGRKLQEAEQQLASAGSKKDPQPTDLQREFVEKSRKTVNEEQRKLAEERRKSSRRLRILAFSVGGIAICAAVALGLAALFRGQAGSAQEVAQAESTARAQAQLDELARKLASQSQQLPLSGNSMIISGLLAAEAARLHPVLASQQSLSRYLNSSGKPISHFPLEAMILAADISPDGQLISAGDSNGLIKFWNINTNNEVLKIEFEGSVWDIKFSPSGDKIATIIGQDLYVLNSANGNLIFHKSMPSDRYFEPTFNSNGKIIFVFLETLNEGTELISYDALTGNEILAHELEESNASLTLSDQHNWAIVTQEFDNQTLLLQVIDWSQGKVISERVFSASYNVKGFHLGDEKIVSIGEMHGEIEIWNIYTGSKFFSAKVCESAVRSISVSIDKRKIAIGCDEGTLTIIDAQNFQTIMSKKQNLLEGNTYDPIFYLDFNTEGNQIVTGGANATVIVWNIDTQEEIAKMPYDGTIRYTAFVPNQNLVVSSGSGNIITVWHPENGLVKTEISQNKSIKAFSFSPEGNLLVASYGDTLQTWDITSHSLLKNITSEGTIMEPTIFSTDGELLVSSNGYNVLSAFDVNTGKLLSSVEHTYCDWIDSISLDINKNIISGCDGGNHFMWNPYNGQILDYMNTSGFPPVLSPNGEIIAYLTESDDYPKRNLILAETETKNVVLTLRDGNAPMDINSDNSLAAFVNSNYETMNVWDIQNNIEVFSSRHDNVINTIEFDSDGRLIISVDRGGNIRVWEALTGNEIARLTMPFQVIDVVMSPDNKLILFSSGGVTLYSWKWNIVDQLEEVCNRLPRNFTNDEWEQFIGSDIPYRPTCQNLPMPSN